jgi:hypothetical protein
MVQCFSKLANEDIWSSFTLGDWVHSHGLKEVIDGLLCYRSLKEINRDLRMRIVRHGIPFKRVEDADIAKNVYRIARACGINGELGYFVIQ